MFSVRLVARAFQVTIVLQGGFNVLVTVLLSTLVHLKIFTTYSGRQKSSRNVSDLNPVSSGSFLLPDFAPSGGSIPQIRPSASSPSMQSPRSRQTSAGWVDRAEFKVTRPASNSGLPWRLEMAGTKA